MAGQLPETPVLVKSIGGMILGGGVLALLVWQYGGVELLGLVMYYMLPMLLIAFAFGLISKSTVMMIWNKGLSDRVSSYLDNMRSTDNNTPTPNKNTKTNWQPE